MRPTVALLAALSLAVAGCAGTGGDGGAVAGEEVAEPPRANATAGAVAGLVLDDEQRPLAKAQVGLRVADTLRQTNTTEGGAFTLNDVPPGTWMLLVQKIGFDTWSERVPVLPGEVSQVEVILVPSPAPPAFPVELVMRGVSTHGGWFQVPYAEAQARLPPGFSAKPHVLLGPNGATAEFQVYTIQYEAATVEGETLPPGRWSIQVLSVEPPGDHPGSYTVQFVVLSSRATDPRLGALLDAWNLIETGTAEIDLALGGLGTDTYASVSRVQGEGAAFTLSTWASQSQATLTGGGITVRCFAVDGDDVLNYVTFNLQDVLYSITGAARVEATAGLAMTPPAPVGEGYVQWGPQATQTLRFEPSAA